MYTTPPRTFPTTQQIYDSIPAEGCNAASLMSFWGESLGMRQPQRRLCWEVLSCFVYQLQRVTNYDPVADLYYPV